VNFKYLPHRAILFLGAVLILIAVIGGSIGVIFATRAESYSTTVTNRYVGLLVANRLVRTDVQNFQVLAERAIAGGAVDNSLVTLGGQDSAATVQAYSALQRLLQQPENAALAPGLASIEGRYSDALSGLATLLTTGQQTPQTELASNTEEAQYSAFDSALANLQTTITNRMTTASALARAAAADARESLLLGLSIGGAGAIVITGLFARKALRIERQADVRDAEQAVVARRTEFEGRLQRALEMARAEGPVFALVADALEESTVGMRSELLLADSSRAHFRQVLAPPAGTDAPGCGVVSPEDCPAASRGQTMIFADSQALDVCPNLRGRACSALCVPVSIGGNSVGVVHVTATDGSPPDGSVARDVEVVVRRASERLSILRAFEVSETRANSDSLTGLLTRRSLQTRVRELHERDAQFVVAYADLDHFKELNDVFGHDAGDRALRMFAQVLRDALRPSDLACRYGGEEFVIVLPDCRVDESLLVLERVRQRVSLQLISGGVPSFTVSVGVASSDQAEHFDDVVDLADRALLEAKASGRDRVVVAIDPVDAVRESEPVS
jgi:diguanylate cyclase (GGDEF)-like protein